jgi:membrane protein required for colicin V production
MSGLDFILLAVIALAVLLGVVEGLVRMVLSWVFFFGAFIAASLLYAYPAAWLSSWVELRAVRNALGFAAVFFAVFLAGNVVVWLLTKWLDMAKLRVMDRTMGGLFGLALGLTLSTLIVFFVVSALPQGNAHVDRSVLAPALTKLSDFTVYTMPGELRSAYTRGRAWLDAWKESLRKKDAEEKEHEAEKKEKPDP